MSMTVEVTVNDRPIRRIRIDNLTEQPTGVNTYRWTYIRTDTETFVGMMSAQQGRLEHVMEDGAMTLISKVAKAAAESEAP